MHVHEKKHCRKWFTNSRGKFSEWKGFQQNLKFLNWSHGTGFKIFSVFLIAKILYINILKDTVSVYLLKFGTSKNILYTISFVARITFDYL
jgi:hypothetical protein